MYIQEDVERGKNENVQTENNIIEKNGEQIMKKILQKLHVQRKFWKHNKNSLCWAFYYVNDGKEVEVASPQVMRCILCYDSAIHIPIARIK